VAEQVTVSVNPKEPDPKPKPKLDAKTVQDAVNTAVVVGGVLSKLPLSDTLKGLLLKLFIFGFGVFCGIGVVYKSGLQPQPQPAPASNVSVYQKRIDELQKENTDLKRQLEEHQVPFPQPQPPVVTPPNPVTPKLNPVNPDRPRPGFIVK
jgi:hypothetical protein